MVSRVWHNGEMRGVLSDALSAGSYPKLRHGVSFFPLSCNSTDRTENGQRESVVFVGHLLVFVKSIMDQRDTVPVSLDCYEIT